MGLKLRLIVPWVLAIGIGTVLADLSVAQEMRYRLGKEVIGFERAFQQKLSELDARKNTVGPLQEAVQAFFQLSLTGAEKKIDEAWISLQPVESQPIVRELIPIRVMLQRRWIDSAETTLKLKVDRAYKTDIEFRPISIAVALSDQSGTLRHEAKFEATELPLEKSIELPQLADGDYLLKATLSFQGYSWSLPEQLLSVTSRLSERWEKVEQEVAGRKEDLINSRLRSIKLLRSTLSNLKLGRTAETDLPANRLLTQLELWTSEDRSSPEWKLLPTQEHWLELSQKGQSVVIRLMQPEVSRQGKALPLVIAYHGAGGSENMFFDAYGAGRIVRLCLENDILLVCPRQPLLGGILSADKMIDELEKIVPVDRDRVFVLGHSMGAAQTMSQIESCPRFCRAVGILGGGRAISKPDQWRSLELFAAAGELDFGRRGVEAFARSAEAKSIPCELKIYDHVEHLGIVQIALDDLFAKFVKLAK